MRYVSLFSGIEAATVAWEPLGWEPLCFAEFDEFPSAVLAERFPEVPNVGDVTKVNWRKYRGKCDLVVGGSPCQSFSIAGKREGLQGESGLMFEYIRAVREIRPRWFLWENVPGALTSEGGEAFRQLLSEMDGLGYGLAWRVLDAQFFGVAQRRRRVFLVGRLGTCPPVEVLFESESLRGDFATGREERARLAAEAGRGASSAGFKFHQGAGAGGVGYEPELSPTCTADWHNPAVLTDEAETGCLNGWDVQSKRVYDPAAVGPTLPSGTSEGMNIQPSVLTDVCIQGSMTGRSDSNGPQGSGIETDGACFTLNCTDRHGIPVQDNAADGGRKTYICETAHTGSNGLGVGESDVMTTLDTAASTAVAYDAPISMSSLNTNATIETDMVGTLMSRPYDYPSVYL